MAFIAPIAAAATAAAGGASTIGLIGAGISAVGSIVSGYQQYQAGKSQAKYMEAQSRLNYANARNARQAAGVEEDRQRRLNRIRAGKTAAASAQSGALLSGTALDVAQQNAEENEMDALLIRYNGELRARGFLNQASTDRYNAATSRSNASQALTGGFIGAGTSLLTGAARFA